MKRKSWLYVVVALGVFVPSCGGAVDTGLFGNPTGTQDSADAAGPTDDGAIGADGGIRLDGGGRFDAGVTDSGMRDARVTDARVTDANPPVTNRIECNTAAMTCALGEQVCCRSGDIPPIFDCTPAAGCNAMGEMPIPCAGADDCTKLGQPGDLCCAQTPGGRATSVSCVPPNSCGGPNTTNLCDPLAADPCPNGGSCQVSVTTLPGFHICF